MSKVLEAIANVFRIKDLRRRILFTLAMLAVYRLGGHIPTPGVNTAEMQQMFEQASGTALGFIDLFSGGQLSHVTIFALGIMRLFAANFFDGFLRGILPRE